MKHPWETCPEGHDLTVANAFLYLSGGSRICRTCAAARAPKRKIKTERKAPGAFQD